MVEFIVPLSRFVTSERPSVHCSETRQTVISVLFTAAMLATVGRLTLRFRFQKRLFADDYVLLFGCSWLIAAFTLTNIMFEDIYFYMSLILGPVDLELQESMSADFGDRILKYRQLSLSTYIICWVIIFAVKMSYLLFFRQLLDRLPSLLNFWKGTLGFVIVSGVFCICSIIISCPHFAVSSSKLPGIIYVLVTSTWC